VSAVLATAIQTGLQSCEVCGLLSRPAPGAHAGGCPRCAAALHFRKPQSLQRTWAFVIAAAVCYLPANLLPVLTTTTAAGSESDTILQGVVLLWSPTGWPLSLIVLFASIMIPSAKILALAYLLITVQRGSIANNQQRIRLYRTVDLIGRWSMVDVFVDAFTAALVPAPAADVGGSRSWSVLLCRRGRAHHAGGRVFRSSVDLGRRKLERGRSCLTATQRCPPSPNPGRYRESAPGSLRSGSFPSSPRRPACGWR
jgi:paraquat-inducible protein A